MVVLLGRFAIDTVELRFLAGWKAFAEPSLGHQLI